MIKEIDIYTTEGRINFVVGNGIMVNGQASNSIVTKITQSLFKKTVYIYLSNKEVLEYYNFQYILIK